MKRAKLAVEKRKVVGKKVKKLRKEGLLPANLYGRNIKSLAVQLSYKDFEKVYKEVGATGIVDVQIDKDVMPSLIHNLQQDYYNHKILHVDFFQVNLKEKVKTTVKIVAIGEPKAVAEKLGLMLQPLSEVEIEALPTNLPEKIEVNVEKLDTVNAQITVGEIKPPTGVTILTDPSQVVVKIGELISKEAATQAAAEQAAAEAAKATAAPAAEGTAPAEGAPAQAAVQTAEKPASNAASQPAGASKPEEKK